MKNKTHFTFFVILVILFAFGFQCNKDYVERTLKYAFKVPLEITPLKKSYTLSDTVWVETDIAAKVMFDTLSNKNVIVDSTSLDGYASYSELAATSRNPPDGFCQIIAPGATTNIYRQLYAGSTNASFSGRHCGPADLKWKIGFKPNYRGTFVIAIGGSGQVQYYHYVTDNTYSTYTYRFKATDLNKDIFDALPDSSKRNDRYNPQAFQLGFSSKSIFVVQVL